MINTFKNLFVITLIIGLLDFIYINLILRYFQNMILKIQKIPIKARLIPGILCYLVLIFNVYYFIILQNAPLINAFLLGLTIYSVYELTNYATIKDWNLKFVIADSIWGGILFLLTTFIYRKISK